MRKLTVALAAFALSALPMFAVTSNYHYNENMNCSDCHSMHASAHNNLTDGSAIDTPIAATPDGNGGLLINPYYLNQPAANGHGKLLKAEDVCATCHKDQTFAPDVYGANLNGYQRSAGGVLEVGDTTGGGHVIGSTVAAPGKKTDVVNYTWTELECASCHSPHGGGNFRNLVPYAMRGVLPTADASKVGPTLKRGAFDATKDVSNLGAAAYTFGDTANFSTYYGRGQIVYAQSGAYTFNGTTSNNRMDQFCGVCHGNFHGGAVTETQVGNGTDFTRHPTSTVTLQAAAHNAPNTTFNGVKAFGNVRVYQAAAAATDLDSPGCLSCHKAHGSVNPFGLIYPSRTASDVKEAGDGSYKDLCKSCHSMGGV